MRVRVLSFIVSVLCAVGLGHAQDSMPSVSDPHFCDYWQDRIGVVHPNTKPPKPQRHHSRQPNSSLSKPVMEDFGSPAPTDPDGVGSLGEPVIVAAMGCILSLEYNTHAANFSGVTWAGVSQLFAFPTPINLAALYYISYLYTGNWKHGSAIALRGPGAESDQSRWQYITSDEAISRAYTSYRRWYEEVKRTGLAQARARNLNPLEGTGLSWY